MNFHFGLKILYPGLRFLRRSQYQFQKLSSRGVLEKRCSYKLRKIHMKTRVSESLFKIKWQKKACSKHRLVKTG